MTGSPRLQVTPRGDGYVPIARLNTNNMGDEAGLRFPAYGLINLPSHLLPSAPVALEHNASPVDKMHPRSLTPCQASAPGLLVAHGIVCTIALKHGQSRLGSGLTDDGW